MADATHSTQHNVKKSPLAQVLALAGETDRAKAKQSLIEKVKALATDKLFGGGRMSQDKGWEHVSNKKLLRLHALLSDVSKRFDSRDALITALVAAEGRKDQDYPKHFASWPLPRLWDALRSAERRARAKTAAPKTEAKPAAKTAAKPAAKTAASAKKAAAPSAKKAGAPAAKKSAAKKSAK